MTTSKRTLQPNEKAIISVSLDGRRFNGQKSVAVFVTVGHTYISTARLFVTAFSRQDIVCNPNEAAFGDMPSGQTAIKIVDISCAGPPGWKISEVVVPKDAPFLATVKELYRGPGQTDYRVKITIKKDAPQGRFQETIRLKTNDPQAESLPLLVSGSIQ